MSTVRDLERALRGDVSWTADDVPALVGAADDHGVSALLWDLLSGASEAQLPLRQALASRARAAVARDLLVSLELSGVLGALADSGVRALVIKGAALAYTVYEQPWHRPRLDTDILVAAHDHDQAAAVLGQRGYRRSDAVSTGSLVSHQVAFAHTDAHGLAHVVDLHWKVANPQLLAGALPFEHAWDRAVAAPQLGPAARVLAPVDACVLACIHRLAHHQGHDRLIWLYDVVRLSRAFTAADWAELVRAARAASVAALCHDALRQAHERLACTAPAAVIRALSEAATCEPSRAYVDRTLHRRDVLASDLALLGSWRQRIRLLGEHAFPPAAFVLQRYKVRSRAWLPALYVHRLITGAWKWLVAA
jgi:hypothetical protein